MRAQWRLLVKPTDFSHEHAPVRALFLTIQAICLLSPQNKKSCPVSRVFTSKARLQCIPFKIFDSQKAVHLNTQARFPFPTPEATSLVGSSPALPSAPFAEELTENDFRRWAIRDCVGSNGMVEHRCLIKLSKLESSVEMKMRWVTLCLRCRGDSIAHFVDKIGEFAMNNSYTFSIDHMFFQRPYRAWSNSRATVLPSMNFAETNSFLALKRRYPRDGLNVC
jgi:hypothetical protein